MVFVIVGMLDLMLSAPSAELLKVKSTVAKEHAMASANAGMGDAMVWMTANAGSLATNCPDPSSGSVTGYMITQQMLNSTTYVNNLGSTATGGTNTTAGTGGNGGLCSVTAGLTWNSTTGVFPFPSFSPTLGTLPANAWSNNFVRFGDPVISRGEYAYRIVSLGNYYYQVDVEGRSQGSVNAATVGTALQFVSRITAVIYLQPPSATNFAPNMFVPANRTTPPAFGTAGATLTMTAPNNPESGVDNAGGTEVAGIVLANPAVTLNAAAGTAIGNPPINTSPTTGQLTIVDNVVAAAAAKATAMGGTGNSGTFYAAKWSGSALVAGSQVQPQGTPGATYVQVAPGSTVSFGDLFTLHGPPGSDGGVVIIDLGGPGATGASSPISIDGTGLFLFNGNHKFQGTVIIYQRAPVTLTSGNALNLSDSTGSPGPRGANFQFNSTYVKSALSQFYVSSAAVASYTVIQ